MSASPDELKAWAGLLEAAFSVALGFWIDQLRESIRHWPIFPDEAGRSGNLSAPSNPMARREDIVVAKTQPDPVSGRHPAASRGCAEFHDR